MRRVARGFLLLLVVSIGSASFLRAQAPAPTLRKLDRPAALAAQSIAPNDYGVQDETYTVIPATDFRPLDSTTGYAVDLGSGILSRTGGGGEYFAHAINIPPGAILADITTYVSDISATSDVKARLALTWRGTGTGVNPHLGYYDNATAQSTGMPGYTAIVGTWNGTLGVRYNVFGQEVDDVSWLILMSLPTTDTTTGFNGVRLRWKRQVSPAPSTPTFGDVPQGHIFYQYIEALAASGITTGCGGGNYCPDTPLTRGQMAVFLARALGLHWTP